MAKIPLIVTTALALFYGMPDEEQRLFREMFDPDGLILRAVEQRVGADGGDDANGTIEYPGICGCRSVVWKADEIGQQCDECGQIVRKREDR
jgi:hypothetical protein